MGLLVATGSLVEMQARRRVGVGVALMWALLVFVLGFAAGVLSCPS